MSLYNAEVKERFLNTYDNEQTQKTIRNTLSKATGAEELLGKDLCNFNLTEIGKVIKNSNPYTKGVARSTGRFITAYISWAIEEGLRESNLNPMKGLDPVWYEQFIDKTKKIHFSDDEFFDIVESLENAQDQAFLSLMYVGLLGQRFSELQQLHYNHINWITNEIEVHNEKGEYDRTITVDNRIMRYVENAYKQTHYKTIVPETGEFNERELVKTDYIFQNTKSPRVKEGEPVSLAVFYNRMNNIKAESDLDYLTPNAIKQSGMIKLAVDLVQEKIENGGEAKVTYQEIEKIGEKYRYAKFNNNGMEYYNTTLMKEFVNEKNIKELYNLDIQV